MLILATLERKSLHGYALSLVLRDSMPDEFKFGMGMLYPLLHKLEKQKYITGAWQETGNGQRRVYELTRKGEKELQAKKADWVVFQKAITRIIHAAV